MSLEAQKKQISVQFNDVHLHAQPLIFDHRLLKYRVEIHRGTGWFEVPYLHSRRYINLLYPTLYSV